MASPSPEVSSFATSVHVGCSGWSYRDWRGELYPPELAARCWLARYAAEFDTVEVNATFYRLPDRETVARWAGQVPEHFCFAVKASRYLTHVKRLTELDTGLARFYARIEPLSAAQRLGPVLWQLPETFKRDEARLRGALERLPPGRHAFEFRHPSWFAEDIYDLLSLHGVALVIGDHPERRFQTDRATTDWRYVRLHFGARGRRGNYSVSELEQWIKRLQIWRSEGDVFVYLNNDWEAFAIRNGRYLRDGLRAVD